ncbi:CRISPR-associated protein Cas4 [Methanobacterium ferruginis]|uniref:CRISPR-associated protein Cas4 n=1 Tax=Methanobacterium ferruginis TaxID=710191 RepID=UPI0025730EDA|nr:CRISPR-associated protein Cas4 [Methanobacterium ferruginis]BDZ66722.1 CRISPR-associated protein Cas4 [Methanobacterium ferruginis]
MLSGSEKHLQIMGTQINYYFICKTKLWFFSHHIKMEQESDLVSMGKQLHQGTYQREKRDYTIDNLISIDFIKKGDLLEVHEVKKSKKMEKAHEYQLLYYLYYLNVVKGVQKLVGVINYPKMRQKMTLEWDGSREDEIRELTKEITSLIDGDLPKPIKTPACRKCAYYELCWV